MSEQWYELLVLGTGQCVSTRGIIVIQLFNDLLLCAFVAGPNTINEQKQ